MKNFFVLSMLISAAMLSSCQKQDSTAEQQLAERKADLDAREKALDAREKALVRKERSITNIRKLPVPAEVQTPDAAQLKAERDRRIQALPADAQAQMQGLIADPGQQADRESKIQERLAQRQRRLEALQKARMAHAIARPAAEAASTTPSPAPFDAEATSPSLSPTPAP
jgi:hypothetical protein